LVFFFCYPYETIHFFGLFFFFFDHQFITRGAVVDRGKYTVPT